MAEKSLWDKAVDYVENSWHKVVDTVANAGTPNEQGPIGVLTDQKNTENATYQLATGNKDNISSGIGDTLTPKQHSTIQDAIGNLGLGGMLGMVSKAEASAPHTPDASQGAEKQR